LRIKGQGRLHPPPLGTSPAAQAPLRPGSRITLAGHCPQTVGGQGIDVGLAKVRQTG